MAKAQNLGVPNDELLAVRVPRGLIETLEIEAKKAHLPLSEFVRLTLSTRTFTQYIQTLADAPEFDEKWVKQSIEFYDNHFRQLRMTFAVMDVWRKMVEKQEDEYLKARQQFYKSLKKVFGKSPIKRTIKESETKTAA